MDERQEMTILLTGSAGHIGKHAAAHLSSAGHTVRTLDRENADFCVDLRDFDAVVAACDEIDAVVHCGAIANDWKDHDAELMAINTLGTFHVFQACVLKNIKRVVAFSSVQALGVFSGFPPDKQLPLTDDYPSTPNNAYQLSKKLGEETALYFFHRYGIESVSLRPVYVSRSDNYAQWKKSQNEASAADRNNWSKGDLWAYVDVRDVCRAIELGLTATELHGESLVLAAADTLSTTPTAELVAEHYADLPWVCDKASYLATHPNRSLVDTSRAKEVLGWEPLYSWRD
jgi:UDP-glucose 4-epimerase